MTNGIEKIAKLADELAINMSKLLDDAINEIKNNGSDEDKVRLADVLNENRESIEKLAEYAREADRVRKRSGIEKGE